jgi:hypothetical protein
MNVDEISWMVGGSVEILCVESQIFPPWAPLLVASLRCSPLLCAWCQSAGAFKDRLQFVHSRRKVGNQRVWDEFRGEGAGVALAGQASRLTAAGVMEGPRRQGHPQNLA